MARRASGALGRQTAMQIDGIEELKETLTGFAPREVNNILRNTVHGLAGRVRDELRRNVPKRTRDLERSIITVRRRGKPGFPISDVRGGGTAPYMLMTEFGTKHSPAQPFIVPTVESMRGDVPRHYREEFGKKLEAALKKRAKKAAKK
jgi:HK97 gp10 family phage protein